VTTDHAGDERRPYVAGAVAGLAAWIAGYVGTYLVVGSDVRESGLNWILEVLGGEPATYELVGWVFYNAHQVDTVFRGLPVRGTVTASYVGGENGFTTLLYAIPIVALLVAGGAVAARRGARTTADGAVAGVTVLAGYLVASIAGVVLFEVGVGDASAAPDAIPAVVLAGVVYPSVIGATGGVVAALVAGQRA
jgi:hypothetical protein